MILCFVYSKNYSFLIDIGGVSLQVTIVQILEYLQYIHWHLQCINSSESKTKKKKVYFFDIIYE